MTSPGLPKSIKKLVQEMSPLGDNFCLHFGSLFGAKISQFTSLYEKRAEKRATKTHHEKTFKNHTNQDPEIWGRR